MVSFGATRYHFFAVIVALASGMSSEKEEESPSESLSDATPMPISEEVRTSVEKSPFSNKLENVRDKVCDLEITGVLMFDYVKAVPVYCNGHKWLSLSAESGTRPLGSSPDNPGKSCRHIKENVINARSGVYWIYPSPPRSAYKNPFQIYCEMSIVGRIANQPPEWITPAGSLLTVEERKFGTVDVKATDPENERFYYVLPTYQKLPTGFKLDHVKGTIFGTAADVSENTNYDFLIQATDIHGAFTKRKFSILITTPYVAGSKRFVSSGSTVQFVVPNGVPSRQYPLTIKIWGAGGGKGGGNRPGGGGGYSRISVTSGVKAGDTLLVTVGVRGSNGATACGGGGGGGSCIRRSSDNFLILAAGGGAGGAGGSRSGNGGAGGGLTGGKGTTDSCSGNQGGGGGTQSGPGSGGSSGRGYSTGQLGQGQNGGHGGSFTQISGGAGGGFGCGRGGTSGCVRGDGGGGGGGGGFHGGGGGGAGCYGNGGGGGSGFFASSLGTGTTVSGWGGSAGGRSDDDYTGSYGNWGNDGYVVISW